MDLTFVYDVVCPYAYLASTRVEALAARHGATLRWAPVLLGGIFRQIGTPDVPAAGWPRNKVLLGERDLLRQAERFGVPLVRPAAHPRRTVDAQRLLVAAPDALRPALTHALYRAYWVEGRDVASLDVLGGIAREHGLDPAVITDPSVRQALVDQTAWAVGRGVFGVPSFLVGDTLQWGSDRLGFVEEALGGQPSALPGPRRPLGHQARLRFFHDVSSPFSYLASTQVARVAAEHHAHLEWVPILLGGLFRAIGTPDVPLFAMAAPRQAWFLQDLNRWAARWGVPFRFPSTFPVRSVLPLRVALCAPEVTPVLYRALWAEDRDIGHPDVLCGVLSAAGFDGPGLLAAAERPGVKAALRQNTEDAAALGACGVPSFLIDGDLLIWGQDRLDQVEAALDGWRPVAG